MDEGSGRIAWARQASQASGAAALALMVLAATVAAQAATAPHDSAPGFRALPGTEGGFAVATPYGEARLVAGGVVHALAGATVAVRLVGGEKALPQAAGPAGPSGPAAVIYENVWPGIDLVYTATASGVKYE